MKSIPWVRCASGNFFFLETCNSWEVNIVGASAKALQHLCSVHLKCINCFASGKIMDENENCPEAPPEKKQQSCISIFAHGSLLDVLLLGSVGEDGKKGVTQRHEK